jgi:hypothetical protein
MTLDEDIEIIGLPKNGEFKVVQLIVDQHHPVMVCGKTNSFHKDLLEDYLKYLEIQPEIDVIPIKTGGTKKLPKLEGERYRVVGMGSAEISSNIKFFQLPYGISVDYQIGVNEDFKKRLKQQFAGWEF